MNIATNIDKMKPIQIASRKYEMLVERLISFTSNPFGSKT